MIKKMLKATTFLFLSMGILLGNNVLYAGGTQSSTGGTYQGGGGSFGGGGASGDF